MKKKDAVHNQPLLKVAVGLTLLTLLMAACGLRLPWADGAKVEDESKVTARPDAPAVATLEDGATLGVPAGRVSEETEVALQRLDEAEVPPPAQGEKMGPLYRVEVPLEAAGSGGLLVLPIDDDTIPQEQLQNVRIVYLAGQRWVSLPSTVDEVKRTVSAQPGHFSIFSWIWSALLNDPPTASLSVSPRAYTDFQYEYRSGSYRLADVEPVEVDVYARDPDGEVAAVLLGLTCQSVIAWGEDLLVGALDDHVEHAQAELIVLGGLNLDSMAAPVAESLRGFKPGYLDRACLEPQALREQEPGHYRFSFDVSGVQFTERIAEIQVYVHIFDDRGEETELFASVPIREGGLPSPPKLTGPGPDEAVVCPSMPAFSWQFGDRSDLLDAWRFRLVEGAVSEEKLWDTGWLVLGGSDTVYDWETFGSLDKDREAADFYAQNWSPPGALEDGVYSWGIIVSADKSPQWDEPDNFRSDVFHFTVSDELGLETCRRRDEATLRVVNSAPESICTVYAVGTEVSEGWGQNLLAGAQLPLGQSRDFVLPPGTYDLLVEPCTGGAPTLYWSAPVTNIVEPFVVEHRAANSLEVANRSGDPICSFYVTPVESGSWGSNQLDAPLQRDESQSMALSAGAYDILLENCDGEELLRLDYYLLGPAVEGPPGLIEYWGADFCTWEHAILGNWVLPEGGNSEFATVTFLDGGGGELPAGQSFTYACRDDDRMHFQATIKDLKIDAAEVDLSRLPEVEIDMILQVNAASNSMQLTLIEDHSRVLGQPVELPELELISFVFERP